MMSNCKILQMDEELVCDTPVPFYEMGISCGLPNEMGDIPPEMMMVPGMLTRGRTVSLVIAEGDSMIGVNIHDGDLLMVERTSHFNNQDIVAAKINGEDMLKSYYMDEYGRHWLVPSNERYDATLLPDHGHLPHEAELRRMAVDCFSKPFDTWRDEKAPVHGQHYLGYYDAGAAMLKALP